VIPKKRLDISTGDDAEGTRRRAKTTRKNFLEVITIRKCPWILIRRVELG
jgi:hypothetical protein